VAVEHWYRHRTEVESIFRDSKHGAALRHLPSGDPDVNTAWMWGALLAASVAGRLHQLTATTAGEHIIAGHGVRDGKAMNRHPETSPHPRPRPARPPRRTPALRLPPGHNLLAAILSRLRALPALP
jgi:hypothetical protein